MRRSTILVVLCAGMVALIFSSYFAGSENDSSLVEVDIKGLVIDPKTESPVVILVGKEVKKALPIFIGTAEAGAIALGLEQIDTERPMTHDLMKSILDGLETRVERVIITDLRDDVFFAQIVLRSEGSDKVIDSRPSDAIALAIRSGSPIYVSADVMNNSASPDLTGWMVEESLTERFGFKIQNVTAELLEAMGVEEKDGVLVSFVEEDSPAGEGGLNRGDIILSLQGSAVSGVSEFDDVLLALPSDEEISMVVTSPRGRREIMLIPTKEGE